MTDREFMDKAFLEAKKAYMLGEVPVGCIIVVDGEIIATGHNERHKYQNGILHAEVVAIQKACKKLKRWALTDATIYVTVEPCLMCTGAILASRIKRLVYGAKEPRMGCVESVLEAYKYPFTHHVDTQGGVMEEEVSRLMRSFFKELRQRKKNMDEM